MEVVLSPHAVFHIFHVIPVTTSHLALMAVTLLLFVLGLVVRRHVRIIPGKLQIILEGAISFIDGIVENAIPDRKMARKVFPFILTFFITLLLSNLFGMIPLASSLVAYVTHGTHEVAATSSHLAPDVQHFPLFHVSTTHLSMTLAFAIVAVLLTHAVALTIRPLKHVGNYIKIAGFFKIRSFMDLINAGIDMFLGIMEIIGEFAKIVSLSCRLFGNIFAEEVMILVIMGLSAYTQLIVPTPMIGLAIFGGVLQTIVFCMLATQYFGQAIAHVTAHDHH